ncbi:MAG: hypothetical protein FWG10_10900 [Eubacteriaceae bacterium]|nr:hypothetical protein [Eubacteriaceae bacterium]
MEQERQYDILDFDKDLPELRSVIDWLDTDEEKDAFIKAFITSRGRA